MPYKLVGKASIWSRDFCFRKGDVITDEQWTKLDALRQVWFVKIEEKIKEKLADSPVQPLPVEPMTKPPIKLKPKKAVHK